MKVLAVEGLERVPLTRAWAVKVLAVEGLSGWMDGIGDGWTARGYPHKGGSRMNCTVCGDAVDPARLELWPWAKTCTPACSIQHEASTQRRHRRDYRRRRNAKARAARAALRRETDQSAS